MTLRLPLLDDGAAAHSDKNRLVDGDAVSLSGEASAPSLVSTAAGVVRNAASLGFAQGVSRLCSVALIAYVARMLGVEALGQLALGLTIATYVRTGMDLGMPLIGARLIAANPQNAPPVAQAIQLRRLVTAAVAVAIGCTYALLGPIPASARVVSFVFVLAVIPWAFSLEWLVWGLERFGIQAASQIAISLCHLAISVLLFTIFGARIVYIACAYGGGMLIATLILRDFWKRERSARFNRVSKHATSEIQTDIAWSQISTLGVALLLTQLFQTVDVMLMGALSNPEQLGFYSAGLKVMLVVYGAFYVATQAAYPVLARVKRTPSVNRLLFGALVAVGLGGCAIAALLGLFAEEILVLAYGAKLAGAAPSFKILLAALPLEFLTASLGTVLISDGRNGSITIAVGVGALTSIVCNVLLIPGYGAVGASWAKIASYSTFFAALTVLLLWNVRIGDGRSAADAGL